MLESIGIPLLLFLLFALLIKKPVYKLWDSRACQSYSVEVPEEKKISVDGNEVKFLILSDTGSGDKNQGRVAESSQKTCDEKGCDLVILAGDNFIQTGVSSTNDEQWDSKFESMYSQNLLFFAALGNHDLKGNWKAQIEYTKISDRWYMPSTNYSFTAGPIDFQIINTTCSITSLWRLYRKKTNPWTIGIGHHPAISSGRHGGMTWLERFIVSRSGIDFFISGHNHVMEHLIHKNFEQIIAGGGGSPIEKSTKPLRPETRYFNENFGYIWANITPDQAKFHFFDIDGKETYQSITRQKQNDSYSINQKN